MSRVIVYCEGQTEESFVNKVLRDYFAVKGIYLSAMLCNIKGSHRGGVSKYSIIKKEIGNLCKSDTTAIITSFLDYYALPSDTPGRTDSVAGTIYDKVSYVESKMAENIDCDNFIPNLTLHEFEALLFSVPEAFAYCGDRHSDIAEMKAIRADAETPEHINDSPNTAPSKRVEKIYPNYRKPTDGLTIALDIGLDKIRAECRHFDAWIKRLEEIT